MIKLIDLDYEVNSLEPIINKETVEIHHGKHHQAYVNNLNGLLEKADSQDLSLDEVLLNVGKFKEEFNAGINNNAGGVYMHNVYFEQFSKNPQEPTGEILDKINSAFNSYDSMLEELKDKAAKQFGSGWSALVVNGATKSLEIVQIPNQDVAKVIQSGLTPIVALDVWEHAYYLDYQNRRPEYLENVVKLIDWKKVEEKYLKI